MTTLADDALALAARGWHVFPLARRGKAPMIPERDGGRGWHDATTDRAAIARWWQAAPSANVGVACAPSRLLVLDVDPRHGGGDELHRLQCELGALPPTVECLTGGGGQHLYFAHPGVELRGALAAGVELKDRGYVVAPPSAHPSGRRYAWSVDRHPDELAPDELPAAWLAAVRAPAAAPRALSARRSGADPLAQLDPPTYFRVLAGVTPDRRGKVRCPLPDHPDRGPSCHVYPTAEAGWYCFGCRRGGTIIDLAALLAGERRPLTRGAFLRVQDALLTFLERQAVAA